MRTVTMDGARRTFLRQVAWSAALGTAGGAANWLAPGEAQARSSKPKEIVWKSWHEGIAKAAAEHKAIGLLIYADWCPHCRELEPLFHTPDIVKAAEPLIMIRHNADTQSEWLAPRFGALGSYVPRLFFLHPDATVAKEITSGNPRFPYFYQPHHPEKMKEAMKAADALGHKKG